MSRPSTHNANQASSSNFSTADSTSETLFLLSISRDEDDAAALRSDLKRSTLKNYKIQHCANLDDAQHLMDVCGFDLVFIRLDDFHNKQSAVDLIRKAQPGQTIIALATSRLLASSSGELPEGVDATCRIEDLSPSLVSTLVQTSIERKKEKQRQERLESKLRLALEASQLGSWKLDIDSGSLTLDAVAQSLLNTPHSSPTIHLNDAIDEVYPEDHGILKFAIDQAIQSGSSIKVAFRINGDEMPLPKVELSGIFSKGTHAVEPSLYGVIKRLSPSSEILERISNANSAIQNAMDQRDNAMLAASAELKAIAEELKRRESIVQPPRPQTTKSQDTIQTRQIVEKPAPAIKPKSPEKPSDIPKPRESESKLIPDNASLQINKQSAFQNVLKSIALQNKETDTAQDSFPFDFSTETKADYSEPSPQSEGFVAAAKRLVNITQKAHKLWVTLSFDDQTAVESEQEKELLFEILKELLTNVVKHARATECIVALFRDEDEWVLQIEDDGVGLENNLISISSPLNQMGLFRIRTKLSLKGGQLDLTPSYPTGLIARARLPITSVRNESSQQGA